MLCKNWSNKKNAVFVLYFFHYSDILSKKNDFQWEMRKQKHLKKWKMLFIKYEEENKKVLSEAFLLLILVDGSVKV